jgi:hemolysin activation/secretion protein
MKTYRFLLGSTLLVFAASSWVQPIPDSLTNIQNIERRQAQDAQQARALTRPDVLSGVDPSDVSETLVLPPENPCFVIRSIAWQELAPPSTLVPKSKQIVGHCVGAEGLRIAQRYFIDQLKAAGQPTAQVFISEQSLASATLTLRYVPGRIARIEDKAAIGRWQTVLPMRSGEVLHQYDLDQALENIRRLAGQSDATLEIEPGENAGESNLFIKSEPGKRWHGPLGGDNAGLNGAGQYQKPTADAAANGRIVSEHASPIVLTP